MCKIQDTNCPSKNGQQLNLSRFDKYNPFGFKNQIWLKTPEAKEKEPCK